MPVVDLGKVVGNPGTSMRFRGEWLSGSEYFNNESYIDTVTHNGSLWICKTTNTGQEPIEGDYWGMGAYGTVTGFDATISIPATGWSGSSAPYAQTVSVSGMTATKAVVYALVSNSETPTDTENSNYGKITGISQNTDSVTFYAAEKPTADIVIRAFSGADTEQAADLSIIAAPFDAGSSYLADDYTLYEGQMYKFTENKDPGAWDTSKVTLTTVSDELKSQAAELASQAEDIAELNSRLNLMSVFYYDSGMSPGDDACKNAILASPHDIRPNIIYIKNTGGQNECLYGSDLNTGYSAYILISWYRGVKLYREEVGGGFVIRDIASIS